MRRGPSCSSRRSTQCVDRSHDPKPSLRASTRTDPGGVLDCDGAGSARGIVFEGGGPTPKLRSKCLRGSPVLGFRGRRRVATGAKRRPLTCSLKEVFWRGGGGGGATTQASKRDDERRSRREARWMWHERTRWKRAGAGGCGASERSVLPLPARRHKQQKEQAHRTPRRDLSRRPLCQKLVSLIRRPAK